MAIDNITIVRYYSRVVKCIIPKGEFNVFRITYIDRINILIFFQNRTFKIHPKQSN